MTTSHDTWRAPLLSFVWPGLGQLYRRRIGLAWLFIAASATLAVIVVATASTLRALALMGIVAFATWSIIDACRPAQLPPGKGKADNGTR